MATQRERDAAFRRSLRAWARRNARSFPWRTTRDPFRVLIAEVLLQRSRAATVEPVFRELVRRWPTVRKLADAQVRSIESVIRPLGLISRAARLKALARAITDIGGVTHDPDRLAALPGVGRYVANATVAAAFGRRVPTVDGVSARVYRRYFGLPSDLPAADDNVLWHLVQRVTPRTDVRTWNWAVLDLAAAVCLPQRPRCGGCPLRRGCSHVRHA